MASASFGPTTTVFVDGLDLEHEPASAVVGHDAEVEAAALAHGEGVSALVRADDGAVALDDVAGRRADLLGEPAPGVSVGNEADVVTVGLVRHAEAALGSLGANERLRRASPPAGTSNGRVARR